MLTYLATLTKYPGQTTGQFPLAPMAARAYLPKLACLGVLGQLHEEKLILLRNDDPHRLEGRLTLDGWTRIDEMASASVRKVDRAFVAMWFDPGVSDAYSNGIHPALVEAGYSPPFRVDDPQHDATIGTPEFQKKIDDRILAEIRRASFVVVDVTGGRSSVYFEAGFAEGLGRPIIWCCRKADASDIAFDTRQNAHILWESAADLKAQILAKIQRHGWAITKGQPAKSRTS